MRKIYKGINYNKTIIKVLIFVFEFIAFMLALRKTHVKLI